MKPFYNRMILNRIFKSNLSKEPTYIVRGSESFPSKLTPAKKYSSKLTQFCVYFTNSNTLSVLVMEAWCVPSGGTN